MANVRELRRRIKSVKNIAQVTRAMQMVAASKMRRAQEQVLATRPYTAKAWQILVHLTDQHGAERTLDPLLASREDVRTIGLVLITSDKGLCGAYNHNIVRAAVEFIARYHPRPVRLVTVGRRGRDFMRRHQAGVLADFSDMSGRPTAEDIRPLAHTVVDGFLQGDFDEVHLAYTEFENTLVQRPVVRHLLPISPKHMEDMIASKHLAVDEAKIKGDYIYEPSSEEILDSVLRRFTELQLYQAVLEALASEHSARMVSMRSATDNANQLIEDLTLSFYRARQEAITTEMIDIAGGAEALRSET
jgi:F-type H+-transporting ATPase subunit gamma